MKLLIPTTTEASEAVSDRTFLRRIAAAKGLWLPECANCSRKTGRGPNDCCPFHAPALLSAGMRPAGRCRAYTRGGK